MNSEHIVWFHLEIFWVLWFSAPSSPISLPPLYREIWFKQNPFMGKPEAFIIKMYLFWLKEWDVPRYAIWMPCLSPSPPPPNKDNKISSQVNSFYFFNWQTQIVFVCDTQTPCNLENEETRSGKGSRVNFG